MNEQGGKSATNTCALLHFDFASRTSCLALFGIGDGSTAAAPGGKRFSAPATKIQRTCARISPCLSGVLAQVQALSGRSLSFLFTFCTKDVNRE